MQAQYVNFEANMNFSNIRLYLKSSNKCILPLNLIRIENIEIENVGCIWSVVCFKIQTSV